MGKFGCVFVAVFCYRFALFITFIDLHINGRSISHIFYLSSSFYLFVPTPLSYLYSYIITNIILIIIIIISFFTYSTIQNAQNTKPPKKKNNSNIIIMSNNLYTFIKLSFILPKTDAFLLYISFYHYKIYTFFWFITRKSLQFFSYCFIYSIFISRLLQIFIHF